MDRFQIYEMLLLPLERVKQSRKYHPEVGDDDVGRRLGRRRRHGGFERCDGAGENRAAIGAERFAGPLPTIVP